VSACATAVGVTTTWPAVAISAAAPIATIFLWVPDILTSSRGLHCAWEPAPSTRRTHSVRSGLFGDGGSSSVGVCHGLPVATGRRIRVSRGSVRHVGRPSSSVHLVPPVAEWAAPDSVDRLRGSNSGQEKIRVTTSGALTCAHERSTSRANALPAVLPRRPAGYGVLQSLVVVTWSFPRGAVTWLPHAAITRSTLGAWPPPRPHAPSRSTRSSSGNGRRSS